MRALQLLCPLRAAHIPFPPSTPGTSQHAGLSASAAASSVAAALTSVSLSVCVCVCVCVMTCPTIFFLFAGYFDHGGKHTRRRVRIPPGRTTCRLFVSFSGCFAKCFLAVVLRSSFSPFCSRFLCFPQRWPTHTHTHPNFSLFALLRFPSPPPFSPSLVLGVVDILCRSFPFFSQPCAHVVQQADL